MLKKGSYGLLNIISEKSIFRDQIHVLSAIVHKNVFFDKKKKKKSGFLPFYCIENRFFFWFFMNVVLSKGRQGAGLFFVEQQLPYD